VYPTHCILYLICMYLYVYITACVHYTLRVCVLYVSTSLCVCMYQTLHVCKHSRQPLLGTLYVHFRYTLPHSRQTCTHRRCVVRTLASEMYTYRVYMHIKYTDIQYTYIFKHSRQTCTHRRCVDVAPEGEYIFIPHASVCFMCVYMYTFQTASCVYTCIHFRHTRTHR
jgi:hypothetical protein